MLLFAGEWWVTNRYLDQAVCVLSPTPGTLCLFDCYISVSGVDVYLPTYFTLVHKVIHN